MKNTKFRFSAKILSEWFHKLKNMSKPREKHPLSTKRKKASSEFKSLPHSSSSHLSNESHTCLESMVSPRNSLHLKQSKRKSVYKPSPSSSCSASSGFNKNKINVLQKQDSSNFKLSSSADDIIIDMNNNRYFKKKIVREMKVFDSTEKACPASNRAKESHKTHHLSVKVKNEEEDACRIQKKTLVSNGRRSSANSPRIKLRASSPRLQISPRRSKSRSQTKQVLESFSVIKSSVDPKKDFRESMVEMIEENKMRASQDLEDLLACYLTLNPKEYHDLIIKVFVQVWLETTNPNFASK